MSKKTKVWLWVIGALFCLAVVNNIRDKSGVIALLEDKPPVEVKHAKTSEEIRADLRDSSQRSFDAIRDGNSLGAVELLLGPAYKIESKMRGTTTHHWYYDSKRGCAITFDSNDRAIAKYIYVK